MATEPRTQPLRGSFCRGHKKFLSLIFNVCDVKYCNYNEKKKTDTLPI